MKLYRFNKALLLIVLFIVLGLIFLHHHHQHKLILYSKDNNFKEFQNRQKEPNNNLPNLSKQSGISQEYTANHAFILQQNNLKQPEVFHQKSPNTFVTLRHNVPNQGKQLQYVVRNQPGVIQSQSGIPQQHAVSQNQQPHDQHFVNQYLKGIQDNYQNKQLVQNQHQGGKPTQQLPSKEEIRLMDYTTLSAVYHRYIKTMQTTCKHMIRLGNIKDGGWDICDDEEYRPRINNCHVFSFGINYDFSFDDAIARKYGCQVHSFDPSMTEIQDHRHSDKVYFHAHGLSGRDEVQDNWSLKMFSTIRQELGYIGKPIDVVKMDIEMWELKAIPDMVTSGSLKDVKQFVVEIHVDLSLGKILPTREKYESALDSLRYLYDDGFRLYYAHKNPSSFMRMYHGKGKRWGCHEMSFVRV